jgi:hypothetical protein
MNFIDFRAFIFDEINLTLIMIRVSNIVANVVLI